MRKNLNTYVREFGARTFEEVPFHDADALALAQLAYLKLEGVLESFQDSMTLHDLVHSDQAVFLFSDKIYGQMYRDLYGYMADCPRYKDIKIGHFFKRVDVAKEVQFAAVTCLIDENRCFVAYRGTDGSLVGWKEDLNMSFMRLIPSQKHALDYLKGIARYTKAKLVLAGHSKGGNLAVYAAACASEKIQKRIRKIYSFDGPGFNRRFYLKPGFQRIQKRISKIIPCESVIGSGYLGALQTKDDSNCRIIQGYDHGIIQHDLMRWKIRKGRFIPAGKMPLIRARKALRLNRLIENMPEKRLRRTINTLYDVITREGYETVSELTQNPKTVLKELWKTVKSLEPDEKNDIYHVAKNVIMAL